MNELLTIVHAGLFLLLCGKEVVIDESKNIWSLVAILVYGLMVMIWFVCAIIKN